MRAARSLLPLFFAFLPVPGVQAAGTMSTELTRQLGSAELRGAAVGLLVEELSTGKVLFDYHSDRHLMPASNQKILVADAALEAVGPSHRFSTSVYRLGTIKDGVLWGDLCLVGRGDPGLRTATLYELAASIRDAGVHRVAGDVIADDSYFMLPEPQYVGGPEAKVYFTPNGALSLNYNTIGFAVEGAPLPGPAAQIWPDTPGEYIDLVGRIRTGVTTDVRISRRVLGSANQFQFGGEVASGETARLARAITAPTQYTLDAFSAILTELGIEVAGTSRKGTMPEGAIELATKSSATVGELVYDMNKLSNNFVADQLVLALGAWKFGAPATWPKGRKFLQDHVDARGLTATRVDDGSGLSGQNLTSPRDLVTVLRDARGRAYWPQMVSSLPMSGRDGTLHNRLVSDGVMGRVRAKTGTISGVSTLSGYVFRDDGRVLVFSALINGNRSGLGAAQAVHERLVRAMVTLPIE